MTENLMNDLTAQEKEIQKLYAVLEVNAIISSELKLNKVLDALVNRAREVMDAEASSLMLLDEETKELYFYTLKGEKSEILKSIRLKLGEGISGWVAQNGQPVLVEDCSRDPRFSRKADEASHFVTRSMMCVPLMFKGRALGTIQVLNKKDGNFFNEKDLRIFEVMAIAASVAIENARLHEMATVDSMTRLYMKSYFLARLKEEFRRARSEERPLSIMMTDIDLFRNVNNNFGHQAGDSALVTLAEVVNETVDDINEELREKNKDAPEVIAGRYGGEEFCVLMPNTDSEEAKRYGEMIRMNIGNKPVPVGEGRTTEITISIGVANFPLHEPYIKELEDFIRLADEALYICKNRGRNRVELYSPEGMEGRPGA